MSSRKQPVVSPLITRREFLRLGSIGSMAFVCGNIFPILDIQHLLPPSSLFKNKAIASHYYHDQADTLDPNLQGRVVGSHVDVYDTPSFSGNRLSRYWKDTIVPITAVTIGKLEDSFNMVWYKIGTEGYAHSGDIQPVLTITNPVLEVIPRGGAVAEVTVPFTDARWGPAEDEPVAYRFYYATTYWVTGTVRDETGKPWYAVRDDKWEYMFYAPAAHLRLIPASELLPISPLVPTNQKRIEVHLPQQVMIAYEFEHPVFMARVATGAIFSNGDYSTPAGRYETFHKRPSRHMARGNLAANGYDLPGVPWNSYITEEGIAFHGTYWHNNFGRERSHGCINLTPQAAKWVYLWTMPVVPPHEEWLYEETGTTVDIFD